MTRRPRLFFAAALGLVFLPLAFGHVMLAREAMPSLRSGCPALDKSKPPLLISYERPVAKVWDGDKDVPGVLLRLENNSDCAISFRALPGQVRGAAPLSFTIKDGKYVPRPEIRVGPVAHDQELDLMYLMRYPGESSLVIDGDFHVAERVRLYGGNYVFFDVPLKNFKKGGAVLVEYNYDWEDESRIIIEEGRTKRAYATVEHYVRFDPERLPKEILK
ncbi:MAG TPA: hypothetical protein VN256_03085 [Pyrinomonadaceae bacterium]|nr:hypothetical protein [Pyrinomonadaceae bacterium]